MQSVTHKMADGALPHHAAAILRLFSGMATTRRATIAFELAGQTGVAWDPEHRQMPQQPGDVVDQHAFAPEEDGRSDDGV